MDLKPGVIRGVASNGMLCSERELMLSDNHDGIIDLPEDAPMGVRFVDYRGVNDPMIHIKVTPNRPDALGIRGIARDLAAKGLGTLKPLDAPPVPGSFDSPIKVSLEFSDGDTRPCPLFVGRYFRNVKNGPSPEWLKRRLKAIGLRPISALVDITNYITYAYGRPLHVFDAGKVDGHIAARFARDGEEIEALDGRTYALTPAMTVVADERGPVGIAGVMGGAASGCTEATTSVFLEAAYFDPLRTAATGRKLGIASDARYRFERGVDPAFTQTGAEIGSRMILDLCGGEASHLVIAGGVPDAARSFTLRRDRVRTLGGVDVQLAEQMRILTDLGFTVSENAAGLDCAVPSWRPDVHGEADLVEEVCRIHGLDRVPFAQMERDHPVARPVLNPLQKRMLAARRTLAARGYNEAVTWSFIPEAQARQFGGGQAELRLANPISSELTDMRPSLLPGLIAAAGRNIARGYGDLALGEVGHAYAGDRPQDETLRAAGIRRGAAVTRNWQGGARAADAFDAKADALSVLDAAGATIANVQVVSGAPQWYHPGRSGTLQMGPKNKLGFFGEIHPRILAAMDVKGPLEGFEITLNAIPGSKTKQATRPALDISGLMAVKRDFAFVVDDRIEAAALVKAARNADKSLISDAAVFDVFKLDGGRTSLAIEVTLSPRDKTLTDDDIEAVSARIISAVQKATGGTLRT